MGWTSFHLNQPVKEWFKQLWDNNHTVLDCALVKRTQLFGAIKSKETGEVFCAVYMVSWSRDYYNFSYKDMTEFVGPGIDDCPERILKLLSPLNDENDSNGWARGWRQRVEENLQKKKDLKKAKGGIIKTKEEVSFTGGYKYQYFKKIGRSLFAGEIQDNCFRVLSRVRCNILRYEYEVISNIS